MERQGGDCARLAYGHGAGRPALNKKRQKDREERARDAEGEHGSVGFGGGRAAPQARAARLVPCLGPYLDWRVPGARPQGALPRCHRRAAGRGVPAALLPLQLACACFSFARPGADRIGAALGPRRTPVALPIGIAVTVAGSDSAALSGVRVCSLDFVRCVVGSGGPDGKPGLTG